MGQTREVTEDDVLKALRYKHPENIVLLVVPAIACGAEDNVYGHIYLTKHGKPDFEKAWEAKDTKNQQSSKNFSFYKFYMRKDTPKHAILISLEDAIRKYPDSFDPQGKSSIFSTYNSCQIGPAYGNRVTAIMRHFRTPQVIYFDPFEEIAIKGKPLIPQPMKNVV